MSKLTKDKLSFKKRTVTDEGYLVVESQIARIGIQDYFATELSPLFDDRDPFDIIKVYRSPAEVFKAVSMDSFANKPITNNHPSETVSSANIKDLQVGFTGDTIIRDGDHLVAKLVITDKTAIADIESGKKELSNGYFSDYELSSGKTPEGEIYDALQIDIVGNHIAIVSKGRCGPTCKISDTKPEKETTMKIKILGVDYEVTDQVAQAVTNLEGQLSTAKSETQNLKTIKDSSTTLLTANMETLKTDHKSTVDGLTAKLDDALTRIPTPVQLDEMAERRASVIAVAKKLNVDFDPTNKTCEVIRKEVVKDNCKDVDVETVSVEYINGRFGALANSDVKVIDSKIKAAFKHNDKDLDVDNLVVDARSKFMERSQNAYKHSVKETA